MSETQPAAKPQPEARSHYKAFREIGIRGAVGATPGQIVGGVAGRETTNGARTDTS